MTKRQLLEQLLKLNADVNSTIAGIVSESVDKKTIGGGKTDFLQSKVAGYPTTTKTASPKSIFGGGAPMRNNNTTYGGDPFNPKGFDAFKANTPAPKLNGNWTAMSTGANRSPEVDGYGTANKTSSGAPGAPEAKFSAPNFPNAPTHEDKARPQAKVETNARTQAKTVVAQAEGLARKAANMTVAEYKQARAALTAELGAFNADEKAYLNGLIAKADSTFRQVGDAALTAGADAGGRIETAGRNALASGRTAVDSAKSSIGSTVKRAGESIEARGLGGAIANQARKQGKNFADNARKAAENPREWAEKNPGNAATAGLAGAAAIGGSIYAASQMAKRRRWSAEGCDGIKNPEEKTRCKNYLKSKK